MAVFKVNKTNNFTVMSNYHLKDKNISLKSKGLLSVMLSLPEDWDYSINGLVSIMKENETSLKNTLKELKKYGYLQIIRKQGIKGVFEYTYNIYEKPILKDKEANCPEGGFPPMDHPPMDVPPMDDQTQLNTNKQNIELQNTKNNIYSDVKNETLESAKNILDYINELKGTKYRFQGQNIANILSRLKEFTEQEILDMIKFKYEKWKGTEWDIYIRPITLFNKTKCEEYVNQCLCEKNKKQNNNMTSHYGFN